MIAGIFSIGYLTYDNYQKSKVNAIICNTDDEIKQAMKGLINSSGTVCFMCRDCSWVDEELEKELIKRGSSVLIFASEENEITKRLKENKVLVKYYGNTGFKPESRFTILKYDRDNPQVAIANTEESVRKGKGFKYTLYATTDNGCRQDKWINALALDLAKLCELVCDDKEQST